ncbi:carbohydrate-binding module family 43 protein [Hortaea werneckii]|uniref:1,3-beta-glucanosyltransferase n=1 Tax=Hortaea werneckii TaxID=91943 RepID=A0A3M7C5S4_HORWE|nr:carbohydrate-binding module family 43 protein [Hortaea werneckii]KAI7716401.1 carbohydrate-binding module family 43 protein [Hortaea werneckii]RMY47462.1 hypothetical protein D0865_08647 [Hortaea werneckii]
MRGFGIASAAAALVASTSLFVSQVAAQNDVDPIVIKGSKFFYKSNGTQFYIKGVAYQQDYQGGGNSSSSDNDDQYTDPLQVDNLKRDIPYLKQLMTNTIRVYAVNPENDHQEAMSMLADAGIYVVADLSQPGNSINRNSPAWNDQLYARYTAVIDEMSKYSNTLGYFAGNEVSNQPNNTDASAFVKAAVRDSKAYIKKQGYRDIGVGYATNDDADIRENMADYFNCGEQENAIDFWGYNIYSWCGDSSFTQSGYDVRTKEFSTYSVPVFFAEYGCNEVSPREFTDTPVLYGDKMNDVWSGGIVYMYFQEDNDYGLVSVDGDNVSPNSDFSNLASQLSKVSATGTQMSAYNPTASPAECPEVSTSSWAAKATPLPPTPNQELCSCMYNSLKCVISSDVDQDNYGDLFGTVCGLGDGSQCDGIAANATTGNYGAYSMCNSTEQIAFVLNQYYQAQSGSNQASACNFDGSATTKATQAPGATCSSLLQMAGSAGTNSVSVQPSVTGAGAASTETGGSGSGSGSDSDSDSSSSGSSGSMTAVPSVEFGILPVAFMATVAAVSGFGMLLL